MPVVCLLADGLLVVAAGQLEGYVQPGGDPADSGFGERCGERLNERVTPAVVVGSHAPQVAVEFAAGQEVGECVLLDSGGPPVGDELLADDGFEQGGQQTRRRSAAPAPGSCWPSRRR